jgi:biotin synthase-related radical SAM superfamily protein
MSNSMIEATNNLGESSSNIPELAKKQNLNKDNNREISFYLSIAYILIDLVKENGTKSNYLEKLKSQKKNIFTSHEVPNITLSKYLERMKKYMKLEDNSIILGLIYLDRFCRKTKIILTDYNTHRLLFISILTAVKYQEDKFYTNKLYAQVCGVKTTVLNQMEYEFVIGMGFEFYVSVSLFDKYKNTISTE